MKDTKCRSYSEIKKLAQDKKKWKSVELLT